MVFLNLGLNLNLFFKSMVYGPLSILTVITGSSITPLEDDKHGVIPACLRRESRSDIFGFRSSNLDPRPSNKKRPPFSRGPFVLHLTSL